MKLNFIRLAMSVIIAATMTACSGGGPTTLKPESTAVKGKLGDCFTVVDREYKLKESGSDDRITIELERTDAALPFTYKPNMVCYYGGDSSKDGVGIGLELLDKDGDIVFKTELTDYWEIHNRLADNSSVIELVKLSPNETGSVEFKLPKEDIKSAVSFRVVTAFEPAKEKEEYSGSYSSSSSLSAEEVTAEEVTPESVGDSESSSSSSTSSTDWDAVLDSYDRYVTKYIALAKKVKNGDTSVMSEYAELMSEAQTLGQKLENASDEMTPAQMARYTKIMGKMASAMQ